MKDKRNKLIAYALDFASYLIENIPNIDRAILFGSVVSNEFDEESDIDIFIDTDEKEKDIKNVLKEYENSRGENWKFKGISNSLSLKIGRLDNWPTLKRSIQSNGLLLFGKYKEIPEKVETYLLFILSFDKITRMKKVSLWRSLYGYKQKIRKKEYTKEGLIKELNGRKLERGIILIPSENERKFKDFLIKNKITYKLIEIWTDEL